MPTVGKETAESIRDANGYYADDPRVMRIVEYDNAWGGIAYGIEYPHQIGTYSASEYVRNPRVFWQAPEINEVDSGY